jgi:hypothetical protein
MADPGHTRKGDPLMRLFLLRSLLCLLIMVTGAQAGSAQQVQPLDPEWLQKMYAEGWEKVQEGVLFRMTEGGKYETFSYGAEGLRWVVLGYEEQIASLEERYSAFPSEELAQAIENLREHVEQLNGDLLTAESAESFDGEALEACTFSYDAYADAAPQGSPQGVTATAWAKWTNSCNYLGSTFAYALANAINGVTQTTVTQTDPVISTQAPTMSSSATASANGSTDCRAEAQAEVRVPALNIVYQTPLELQYGCPAVLTASITGPSVATTDYYTSTCANVTWTASATGGYPGFTYKWYVGTGTTVQGTGATFTQQSCQTNGAVTVKVVATDAQGGTDDATFTTTVQYKAPIVAAISGPDTVDTNTSTPCANVTWTASATSTGGYHSGFTYSWYIGTTLAGTGSTLTKTYCNTSQTVTVKLVATASDGHTNEVSKSTTITYTSTPPPSPLTASISGLTSTRLPIDGGCKSITWTAAVSGGTPAYNYSWYLGTSTIVQGTGNSLTKTFCTAQTINVKLTASDSSSPVQAKDATFTTILRIPIANDCNPSCQ